MFKFIGVLFVTVYAFLVLTGERDIMADARSAVSFTAKIAAKVYNHYAGSGDDCQNAAMPIDV